MNSFVSGATDGEQKVALMSDYSMYMMYLALTFDMGDDFIVLESSDFEDDLDPAKGSMYINGDNLYFCAASDSIIKCVQIDIT